jgi:kinesin family protein 11
VTFLAHRAKNICNQPQVNKTLSKKEALSEYTNEIEDLKAQLVAMRQKSGVFVASDQYEEMTSDLERTADEIAQMEEYIITKEKELEEMKELFARHTQDLVGLLFFCHSSSV